MDEKMLDRAIAEVFEEMTPEEKQDVKKFIKIFNSDNSDRAIEEVVRKMTLEEKNMYKRWVNMKNSKRVKEFKAKIHGCTVEHNSFLVPITNDMCRTSQSVPRKGYTSVSRIAKG